MAEGNIAEVCDDSHDTGGVITGGHDTSGVITGMDKMFRDKVTMIEGKKKAPRNVLTRMEALGQSAGPFSILQRSVTDRLKVRVWTRNYRHIHGICTGYVVAYDKHINLVLQDVDEMYKNPARDETEFKVKKKRIRKKKIKNTNRTDTVSDVKSKTVDSTDRVVCNENELESATPGVGEHPLTCRPRSLDVSPQQSAVCDPLLTETPVGGDKCVDDDDDDDEQIKNLLRQVNEITQQLRDLSSSSDDDENNSELDELSKERSRSRNTKDSDIVDASRDSETPDLCKHWSSRTRRPREVYDSPARLRDTNACRNSSHGDRASRSSRDSDEKTHSTKERHKNINSRKQLDQKYEDRNIDAFSYINERRSMKNVKDMNKITSTSIDDDNIDRRGREDIRASRSQRGECLQSEMMMPGSGNSDLRRENKTNVNKPLLTRHVNQLLVRGDNVVMVAIVTS